MRCPHGRAYSGPFLNILKGHSNNDSPAKKRNNGMLSPKHTSVYRGQNDLAKGGGPIRGTLLLAAVVTEQVWFEGIMYTADDYWYYFILASVLN